MDGLAVPFLDAVIGSFVFAVALLLALIFVDSLRQRRERACTETASLPVRGDAHPGLGQPQPAKAALPRCEFSLPSKRAKAA
ncbi:MAG: hypothetical protein IRZ06_04370 [Nevskia sp.]|nr:hypothetical protein [Nevskia sp.]